MPTKPKDIRVPVQSSSLKSVGYDHENRILEVEFNNGGVYHYQDVSLKDYQDLLRAESLGKHLHAHIRGRFSAIKQ